MVTSEYITKTRQQGEISDIVFQKEFNLDTHEAQQTYKNGTEKQREHLREANRKAGIAKAYLCPEE